MKTTYKNILNVLVHIIIYITIYSIVAKILNKPAFPPFSTLINTFLKDGIVDFLTNLQATLIRWLIVFIAGVIGGVSFGVIIGYFPILHNFLKIDIDFLRSLPATALIVFIMAAFGDNEVSRSFPAFYITFFTVLFYVVKHATVLKHPRINHLVELGASKTFIIKNCIIYELLPPIFIAIRQSVSLSFLVLISVELIVGPSGNIGLGKVFYDWMFYAKYANTIIGLIFLGIIGYILNLIAGWGHRKIIYWQDVS